MFGRSSHLPGAAIGLIAALAVNLCAPGASAPAAIGTAGVSGTSAAVAHANPCIAKSGAESLTLSSLKVEIKIPIPVPVLIHFDGNGGTVEYSSKIVFKYLQFGKLPSASRAGYEFAGWYTTKKGRTKIESDGVVKISRSKTYYAHWTRQEVKAPPVQSAYVVKVNINTANQAELERINGVGPVLAEEIIAYRVSHGKFKTIDELKNVKGIGENSYLKLKDQVTV